DLPGVVLPAVLIRPEREVGRAGHHEVDGVVGQRQVAGVGADDLRGADLETHPSTPHPASPARRASARSRRYFSAYSLHPRAARASAASSRAVALMASRSALRLRPSLLDAGRWVGLTGRPPRPQRPGRRTLRART